jgi:hypothetical protein
MDVPCRTCFYKHGSAPPSLSSHLDNLFHRLNIPTLNLTGEYVNFDRELQTCTLMTDSEIIIIIIIIKQFVMQHMSITLRKSNVDEIAVAARNTRMRSIFLSSRSVWHRPHVDTTFLCMVALDFRGVCIRLLPPECRYIHADCLYVASSFSLKLSGSSGA